MATELQTGTVYRIWSPSSPDCYVGATIQELSSRKSGHRADMKRWSADKTKLYYSSYEVLRFPDAKIEWLETVQFKTRAQLAAREGHWIRTLDCVNKQVAGRTVAEYYVDHREALLKKSIEYHAAHRDEMNAYTKQYDAAHRVEKAARQGVKFDCECGGQYIHAHRARHLKSAKHLAYIAALPAII